MKISGSKYCTVSLWKLPVKFLHGWQSIPVTDHINHSSSIAQEVSCISGTYCQVQRLLLAIPHVHNKPKGTYLQPLAGILQYSRREIVHEISIH